MTAAAPAATAEAPRAATFTLVTALFCLSGMTGLVYEVLWSRSLHLVFGVSSFAITITVAAYMAGLALGSGTVGPRADRLGPRAAVAAYGLIEIVIGLFAVAFPPLLDVIGLAYRGFATHVVDLPALNAAIELVLCFALLLVPTTLMGGTLPLIARVLAQRSGATGRGFGWAYAANTMGAVVGVWLAGFVLVPDLGVTASLAVFCAVNVAIGAAALLVARVPLREVTPLWRRPPPPPAAAGELAPPRALLLVATLTGFVSLAAEIVWIRGFASLLTSTTYTFSLVLMVYLVGIALGSAVGARLPARRGALAAVVLVLALCTLTQLGLHDVLHQRLIDVVDSGAVRTHAGLLAEQALLVTWVVLPLTLASGAALPLVVALCSRGLARSGADVGAVYIANTIGSVSGVVVAGFVLLPWIGSEDSARALALLATVAAVATVPGRGRPLVLAGAAVVATMALTLDPPSPKRRALSPLMMARRHPGLGEALRQRGPDLVRTARQRGAPAGLTAFDPEDLTAFDLFIGQEPLAFEQGLTADVAVTTNMLDGEIGLLINGMPNASAHVDLRTQASLSMFTYLLAPRIEDCVHVGLGSGITTGVWAALPGVGTTRAIELEGALARLSRLFAPYHLGLRGVEIIADDARFRLATMPAASLDVVISQPSQLWAKGMGSLFSSEFFAEVKRALRDDGVFCTWIMAYELPAEVWAIAVMTLLDAFEHVQAFVTPGSGDVSFVCSRAPLAVQPRRFEQLQGVGGLLARYREAMPLQAPGDLLRYYLADRELLREQALPCLPQPGLRQTDDRPLLEFLAAASQMRTVHNELLRSLRRERAERAAAGRPLRLPGHDGGAGGRSLALQLAVDGEVDPARAVLGGPREARIADADGMSDDDRRWLFACAWVAGDIDIAGRLWPAVRGGPWTDPELASLAAAYALRHGGDAGHRELIAGLPPEVLRARPELAVARMRMLTASFEGERSRQAASAYVGMALDILPPDRLAVTTPGPEILADLVFAGAESGRTGEVRQYLEAADRLFEGRLHPVGFALAYLYANTGEPAAAAAVMQRYAGWTTNDPWLIQLRDLVAGARRQ